MSFTNPFFVKSGGGKPGIYLYLILAGILVLLGGSVAVRLGHPLGDLGRGEEREHLDGGARPVVGVLRLHYLRVHRRPGSDVLQFCDRFWPKKVFSNFAIFQILVKNKWKAVFDELTISGFTTSSSGTSRDAITPVFLRRVVRGLLGDCGNDSGGLIGAIRSALLTATAPSLSSFKEKLLHNL